MPQPNTSILGYDGLGRLHKTADPRRSAIITSYGSGTSLVSQTSIESGPVITNYYYGADGRVSATSDASGHVSYVAYSARGEIKNRWGDGTAPVNYEYDSFGRLTSQSTYRDPANNINWAAGPDFPSGTSAYADTTTFDYYGDLPLLQHKHDASGHGTSYAYDGLGRVLLRTNARGGTATSTYDGDSGDLMQVAYSDSSQVNYTYKRTGAVDTMVDATGTHTFHYGSDLQVSSEDLPSFYGSGRRLTYTYAGTGVVGRLTQMGLGTSGSPHGDQVTDYGYQSDGRLSTVGANGAGYTNYVMTYTYTPNADNLIDSVTDSTIGYTQTRAYHSQRDVLTSLVSKYGATPQVQYDYTYNTLGQRDSAKQTGTAFADYGNATYNKYTYNGRGELTQAYGYLGTSLSGSDPVLTGRTYQYSNDNAGNRHTQNHTLVGGLWENFTANNLNQITARDNHTVSVQGTVLSGTNVLVTGHGSSGPIDTLAVKSGNYWAGEATLDNTAPAPAYQSIGITAALPGGGSGGADLVATMSKTAFLAPDPEAIHYDLDGNVSDDGRWIYAWNIENQLTQMTTTTAAVTAGAPNVRLTFQYDALGRRVSRKIEDNTGSWVTREELRFVYDGWNLIAEMNTSGTIQRYFTWGLDLSGSGSAMGGIGALLMAQDGGHTYLPAYDGSGNVAAMLDASNGSVAALYEYGPFGDLLRTEGAYAATNRFRWSTHFTDDDTGLVYYGHRYYSPSLGRFINRDPIAEQGGMNLYGFAENDPVNGWDVLGLKDGDLEDIPDPLHPIPPTVLDPYIANEKPIAPYNPVTQRDLGTPSFTSPETNSPGSGPGPGGPSNPNKTPGNPKKQCGNRHKLSLTDVLKAALSAINIKAGADLTFLGIAGTSNTVGRPVTQSSGGTISIDGIGGVAAVAYGGFEGQIPTGISGPTNLSVGTMAAFGLAIGGSVDITFKSVGVINVGSTVINIRIPLPVSIKPYLGLGVGGEEKIEAPSPSLNLLEINVDENGNIKKHVVGDKEDDCDEKK